MSRFSVSSRFAIIVGLLIVANAFPVLSVVAAGASPRPFLSIPFSLSDAKSVQITEGWKYSAEERKVHGFPTHYAVDFAAPRATPVYAAAPGYAISSFHVGYAGMYDGKRVGYGLGKFVQVWNP